MQKRDSECVMGRPVCCVNPAHPIHLHGCYERYANPNDEQREKVQRYLCYPCGHTISVLPAQRLPYVALPAQQMEAHFEAQAQGTAPPSATQKEQQSAKRAWTRFAQRTDALTRWLGQMISSVKPTAALLWHELRRQGHLPQILHLLSSRFQISLLQDYWRLRPWAGE